MNARIVLSALALAAGFAGNAFAESPLVLQQDTLSSSTTRAQVQAELAAYRQSGVNPWSTSYNPLRRFQSATSRAAVVAEYLASRNEVRALTGEDSGSMYLAQTRAPHVPPTLLAGQAQQAQ